MNPARNRLRTHAYAAHATALLLMLLSPLLRFLTTRYNAPTWTYPPLALFIIINLLELLIP